MYDGDGNRVRSTVNGVTTTFVGNYYEVSGSTVTKYYMAGAQRIAMRTGSSVYYLLMDQLGSTSVTTDATGALVSEQRYGAWGAVRCQSGTTPTDYTYTGQYSNMSDFGLMFYKARWYDPAIGRFTSADSIVPGGVQGYDRYAYVNNHPVNLVDPSGHGGKCRDDWSGAKCDRQLPKQERPHIGGGDGNSFGPYKALSRLRAIMPFAWGDCSSGQTYKQCWYAQKLMKFEGYQQIDDDQFNDLLMAVYYDLKQQSLGLLPLGKYDKDLYRAVYDTSFWNGKDAYGPKTDQTVCFGSNCYRRSDINYFAQGMWAAAADETVNEAVDDAAKWKFETYRKSLSPYSEFWVRYGYNAYKSLDSTFGELIENGDFDRYYNH